MKLNVIEMPIEPALCKQLLMRPLLHDMPRVDDIDAVGVEYGGKAVCDDKARPPDHETVERRLHDLLALRVERRRRLIEDEDARVFENRARDRDALALTARNAHAAFADLGIVAVLQLHN